jgi:hypothetical protein
MSKMNSQTPMRPLTDAGIEAIGMHQQTDTPNTEGWGELTHSEMVRMVWSKDSAPHLVDLHLMCEHLDVTAIIIDNVGRRFVVKDNRPMPAEMPYAAHKAIMSDYDHPTTKDEVYMEYLKTETYLERLKEGRFVPHERLPQSAVERRLVDLRAKAEALGIDVDGARLKEWRQGS